MMTDDTEYPKIDERISSSSAIGAACNASLRALNAADEALWAAIFAIDAANPTRAERYHMVKHISSALLTISGAKEAVGSYEKIKVKHCYD
jgi:hypothetical protein